jgi:hypothetical protein
MKCENIKEATTTCTNEASPGLVFCRECLWQHSEELYKADKLRREEEAKIDEIKAEIGYVWGLWERIPEDHFLERYSLEKRARELWADIEATEGK